MDWFQLRGLLTVLIMPLSVGLGLGVVGLLLVGMSRTRRLGVTTVAAGFLLIAVASMPRVAELLLAGLEDAYPPRAASACPQADAILVLGGAVQPLVEGDLYPRLHRGSDRVWEAARLYHAGCAPRVLVSAGGIIEPPLLAPESVAIETFLVDLGVPRSAILSESQSRNTRGNAEASRALAEPLGIGRVLLVSSAWHLRRAVPLFERVGFDVIPVGADYRALGTCTGAACWLPNFEALGLTSAAWKEYLGALVGR